MNLRAPGTINFVVYSRTHSYAPKGEWVLSVSIDGASPWVIFIWNKKPSNEAIDDAKTLALRSMELYHRHLTIPAFNLKEIGNE
jgi:hypothetical protein